MSSAAFALNFEQKVSFISISFIYDLEHLFACWFQFYRNLFAGRLLIYSTKLLYIFLLFVFLITYVFSMCDTVFIHLIKNIYMYIIMTLTH